MSVVTLFCAFWLLVMAPETGLVRDEAELCAYDVVMTTAEYDQCVAYFRDNPRRVEGKTRAEWRETFCGESER